MRFLVAEIKGQFAESDKERFALRDSKLTSQRSNFGAHNIQQLRIRHLNTPTQSLLLTLSLLGLETAFREHLCSGIRLPLYLQTATFCSAPGRIRTCGQRIRSPLLCPLSYGRSTAVRGESG